MKKVISNHSFILVVVPICLFSLNLIGSVLPNPKLPDTLLECETVDKKLAFVIRENILGSLEGHLFVKVGSSAVQEGGECLENTIDSNKSILGSCELEFDQGSQIVALHPFKVGVRKTSPESLVYLAIKAGTPGQDIEMHCLQKESPFAPNGSMEPIPTFNEVAPIIKSKCASCHNGSSSDEKDVVKFLNLKSKQVIYQKREALLVRTEGGVMPPVSPGQVKFRETPDGKKLIQWLRYGQ